MSSIEGEVTVISATNFPAQLDRAFLSRITNFIKMPLPDDSTRKMLFIKYLQDSELSHNMRPEQLSQLARQTERFSFRDCQRQGAIFFLNSSYFLLDWKVSFSNSLYSLHLIISSSLLGF
jgi:SpoVK/Ycf46/Vps4 family AAA+-type ATPase